MPQNRSGTGTRPTTDRVRESLFNVLSARIDFDGMHVLDLFAGSGALGIEALSRGADTATFVESDRRAGDVITANLAELGVGAAVVRRGTVAAVLSTASTQPADLVFADPPYAVTNSDVEGMLTALVDHGWVAPGALAVIERPAASSPLAWPSGWTPGRDRRYGDTRIEFGEHDATG